MAKTDIKVYELVDKVRHGELMLPEMQRRYVCGLLRVSEIYLIRFIGATHLELYSFGRRTRKLRHGKQR